MIDSKLGIEAAVAILLCPENESGIAKNARDREERKASLRTLRSLAPFAIPLYFLHKEWHADDAERAD
jgi:hypothetical protein